MNSLRADVAAFLDHEADLLDNMRYREWLDLWTDDGVYIVPVDPQAENPLDHLNFAYDNAEMRLLRVNRLLSGDSISVQTAAKTVRSVSRLRILSDDGAVVTVRCAQFLAENRHGRLILYPADVTFTLRRTDDGFRMLEKVVALLQADHYLSTIGYIL